MYGPSGNQFVCFPSSPNVSLDFVSVNNLYLLYDKGNCGVQCMRSDDDTCFSSMPKGILRPR